jgi:uncharacterized membrane protein
MKSPIRFLASTLAIGFFAVLPVLLFYLLLGQLVDMLLVLTTPVLDLLPDTRLGDATQRQVVATALLIGLLLLVGIAAQTGPGRRTGHWFERNVLHRLPLYALLRNLSTRLSGEQDASKFRPATVTILPGVRSLCFIVEEHASGDFTVFVPFAPTPTLGSIYVVEHDRVIFVEGKARQALSCVASWGDGTAALVSKPKGPGNG